MSSQVPSELFEPTQEDVEGLQELANLEAQQRFQVSQFEHDQQSATQSSQSDGRRRLRRKTAVGYATAAAPLSESAVATLMAPAQNDAVSMFKWTESPDHTIILTSVLPRAPQYAVVWYHAGLSELCT